MYDGWRLQSAAAGDVLVPTAASPGRETAGRSRSARDMQPALAEAALAELADAARGASAIRDKYAASAKGGCVRRGCSSSSDRRRGTLHALARPLRAAVYARLGEAAPVQEIMPLWGDGAVAWSDEVVHPAAAEDALLDDVAAAAAWLDAADGRDDAVEAWPPDEAAWRAAERAFNRRIRAAELCAAGALAGSADPRAGSLLALMRSFPEYAAAAPAAGAKRGRLPRVVPFEGGSSAGPPAVRATRADCRAPFGISAGELEFLKQKGFPPPRRCKPFRERRKAARPARD